MEYKTFDEVVQKVRGISRRRCGVVAGAEDRHVLEAVLEAEAEGIAVPVLVGNAAEIARILKTLDHDPGSCRIVDAAPGENSSQRAVEVILSGEGDFLIKGKLDTKDILKAVVDRRNNLHREGGLMSHLAFFQVPGERKLMAHSDGGMIVYPDLKTKKGILLNALDALKRMGYEWPKVAVLCAVEKINEKMRETIDARDLAEMYKDGLLPDCVLEGPVSYDIALRPDIAELKGYESPNCGNFDLFIVPDLASGNLLGKCLTVSAHAEMAGIVVGARIPIVLTSRGASAAEKFNSIALCALIAEGWGI